MTKQEKTYLFIMILVVIVALVIFSATRDKEDNIVPSTDSNLVENMDTDSLNKVTEEFVQVVDDGTKLNISEQLNAEKTVGAYKIEDIQLTNKDGRTVLLANVTNVSNGDTELQLIDIVILDKAGEELETVKGIIAPLKAGKSTQLNTGISLDYSNAYDFKIILK